MNELRYFLKKHSSTILTAIGTGGVIVTTVLAVKATPKALQLIEEAKKEKDDNKLTPIEVVKTAWKPYIPAVISGASTIICILGANILNTKSQASLISAYALLNNSYAEYRNKVNNSDAIQSLIASKFDPDMKINDGETLFFDYQSMYFFKSTIEDVELAEHRFLESFHNRGYACLNEFYSYLGIPYEEYGYRLGWFDIENNDPYNCQELEFKNEKYYIHDNIECYAITTTVPLSTDYIL